MALGKVHTFEPQFPQLGMRPNHRAPGEKQVTWKSEEQNQTGPRRQGSGSAPTRDGPGGFHSVRRPGRPRLLHTNLQAQRFFAKPKPLCPVLGPGSQETSPDPGCFSRTSSRGVPLPRPPQEPPYPAGPSRARGWSRQGHVLQLPLPIHPAASSPRFPKALPWGQTQHGHHFRHPSLLKNCAAATGCVLCAPGPL